MLGRLLRRTNIVRKWMLYVCNAVHGYTCVSVLKRVDVVVKIADHYETSDNMGQGVAEREPGMC